MACPRNKRDRLLRRFLPCQRLQRSEAEDAAEEVAEPAEAVAAAGAIAAAATGAAAVPAGRFAAGNDGKLFIIKGSSKNNAPS